MVDPVQLSVDIVGNTISLALPGMLWALLFLLAWEHTPFAESIGFGRWTFWLLLPGAILASLALLPIAPVSYDWVAISLAGALFPLIVGALAFGRAAPPLGRSLAGFLGFLTVEAAVLFVLVLPVSAPVVDALAVGGLSTGGAEILLITLVAALFVGMALLVFPRAAASGTGPSERRSARVVGFALALTGGVLATTFAASAAIPGVGIVEQFPEYLLPPIAAGLIAALVAPRIVPGQEGYALPVAYFASTFGVLLGADLLRQPPLYGTGPAGVYTIGGAGVLDLVYLSGLLALAAAYVGHVAAGRSFAPVDASTVPSRPNPSALLVLSYRSGVRGDLAGAIASADQAAREAAAQARRLLDLPEAPPDRPWDGIAVPGWVVADQANLDALARSGTNDPREGFRAWLTARWLVTLARELSFRRFGSLGARTLGFLLDLAIILAPALAIWSTLIVTTPGSLVDLLDNVGFNAAIYGFIALGFFYFALSETLFGTTLGKRLLGLMVRDRQMRRPAFAATLVRNAPLLPVLTILGIGGALAAVFVFRATDLGTIILFGYSLPAGVFASVYLVALLVGGIVLLGSLGLLVIVLSSERQRLGDLWAGTWVVRSDLGPGAPIRVPLAVAPVPAPPPEPVRSG